MKAQQKKFANYAAALLSETKNLKVVKKIFADIGASGSSEDCDSSLMKEKISINLG